MARGEHVFYTDSNGDVWSLVRTEGRDTINVKHQVPSGGEMSLTTLQSFLAGPYHRQHSALFQLIRTMIGEALDREVFPKDTKRC
jgi:hypothetical protein